MTLPTALTRLLGPRTAMLLWLAVPGLLCITPSMAAVPASATLAERLAAANTTALWSATCIVDYPSPDLQSVATVLASIGARLRVLDNAEAALKDNALMRLLAQDRVNGAFRRMALVASAYPVHTRLLNEEGRVVGEAVIRKSPHKVETLLREALRKSDNLDLWAEVLASYSALSREGMELLARERRELDAARSRQGSDTGPAPQTAPQTNMDASQQALLALARKIEALDLYSAQLRTYDEGWPDPQTTLAALDKALELDPGNVFFKVGRAEALTRLDRVYEALDTLNEAARNKDFPARGHAARGMAQLRLHMPSLAVHDFSRALALRDDKAAWWHARGAAKLLAGELDSLCEDLEKACSLGDCQGLANVRTRKLCQ